MTIGGLLGLMSFAAFLMIWPDFIDILEEHAARTSWKPSWND